MQVDQRKSDGLDIANKAIGPLEVDHVRKHGANRSNEEPMCECYPRWRQPAIHLTLETTNYTPL